MKEMRDLIDASKSIKQSGISAALATIVKVTGSHYRRPGAKMLVPEEGTTAGSISGGCFETDLLQRAKEVLKSRQPVVLKYDTSSDEDIVWGSGSGCGGEVHVLVEPFPEEDRQNPVAFLQHCNDARRSGVMATVFGVDGNLKVSIGDRLMLADDNTTTVDFEDRALAKAILMDAGKAIVAQRSENKSYSLAQGKAQVFLEVVRPLVWLAVFGAGDDAVPLVGFARELGWHITLFDHRNALATSDRFPGADSILVSQLEDIKSKVQVDTFSAAVILTHNFLHDLELLKILLPASVKYLGVLGARKRTERLLEEVGNQGTTPTPEQLQRLYSPVGIDIGSETPAEIALSIVAEIQTVLSNRSAGFLKNRKGSTHT